MLIRIPSPQAIRSSEITPERIYAERRRFITQFGLGAAVLLAGCRSGDEGGSATPAEPASPAVDRSALAGLADLPVATRSERAGGEGVTPFDNATQYNNYYEFGTDKTDPARNAHTLQTRPWTLAVEGECEAPGSIGIEDLVGAHNLEERIYRFRCVETWSMVVPWVGVPLADVLARFKPTSKARYVAFQTLYDRQQMPLAGSSGLQLPYVEGLRIDEATHPLTLLTVGMYGKTLPNQNGAPLRLIVPWKYGYKSIKSIVKIRFTETEPPTTWNRLAPDEYGFYSNVHPNVRHPRWSQASERRLGELFKRDTLLYNGYSEVAALYAGMDPVQFH